MDWLTEAVYEAERDGIPWQAVIDAFRPRIPEVWAALPLVERAIFLTRYRSRWEVIRHRAPPDSLRTLEGWMAEGQLQKLSGEILDVQTGAALQVTLRGAEGERALTVDRIILCSGADTDVRHASNPALAALLARGRIQADPLGLGIEVDALGHALDAAGEPDPTLWVLGAARRPRLWETTAVPELSRQAEALAGALVSVLERAPQNQRAD